MRKTKRRRSSENARRRTAVCGRLHRSHLLPPDASFLVPAQIQRGAWSGLAVSPSCSGQVPAGARCPREACGGCWGAHQPKAHGGSGPAPGPWQAGTRARCSAGYTLCRCSPTESSASRGGLRFQAPGPAVHWPATSTSTQHRWAAWCTSGRKQPIAQSIKAGKNVSGTSSAEALQIV